MTKLATETDKEVLKRVMAEPTFAAVREAAIRENRQREFGASLSTAMGATDKEVAEIEALASERSVLHWAGIIRIIQRMRNAEASADEGWKRAEENAQEAEKLRALVESRS